MNISRSTRKNLIITLSITLVILVGVLFYLLFGDNNTFMSKVKTNDLAKGVNEIKSVENPFKDEEEKVASEEESELVEVVVEEPREEVYEGKTLEEVADQLDRSLNDDLSGKGYLYASYCLERGVDPYLAAAISLEETGCTWGCSSLVKTCNNVGGMKGSGCGAYGYFSTLDDGIRAFIDNIANNYVAYGLTTADTMNPKYAENPSWASNVNAYIYRIKNK